MLNSYIDSVARTFVRHDYAQDGASWPQDVRDLCLSVERAFGENPKHGAGLEDFSKSLDDSGIVVFPSEEDLLRHSRAAASDFVTQFQELLESDASKESILATLIRHGMKQVDLDVINLDNALIALPRHPSGEHSTAAKYMSWSITIPLIVSVVTSLPSSDMSEGSSRGRSSSISSSSSGSLSNPGEGSRPMSGMDGEGGNIDNGAAHPEETSTSSFSDPNYTPFASHRLVEDNIHIPAFPCSVLDGEHAALPLLCLGEERELLVAIASSLYHRRAWSCTVPVVGLTFSQRNTLVEIVFGWIDTTMDEDVVLPPIHLGRHSNVDLSATDTVRSLISFFASLGNTVHRLQSNTNAGVEDVLVWRLDTVHAHDEKKEPVTIRFRKWAEDVLPLELEEEVVPSEGDVPFDYTEVYSRVPADEFAKRSASVIYGWLFERDVKPISVCAENIHFERYKAMLTFFTCDWLKHVTDDRFKPVFLAIAKTQAEYVDHLRTRRIPTPNLDDSGTLSRGQREVLNRVQVFILQHLPAVFESSTQSYARASYTGDHTGVTWKHDLDRLVLELFQETSSDDEAPTAARVLLNLTLRSPRSRFADLFITAPVTPPDPQVIQQLYFLRSASDDSLSLPTLIGAYLRALSDAELASHTWPPLIPSETTGLCQWFQYGTSGPRSETQIRQELAAEFDGWLEAVEERPKFLIQNVQKSPLTLQCDSLIYVSVPLDVPLDVIRDISLVDLQPAAEHDGPSQQRASLVCPLFVANVRPAGASLMETLNHARLCAVACTRFLYTLGVTNELLFFTLVDGPKVIVNYCWADAPPADGSGQLGIIHLADRHGFLLDISTHLGALHYAMVLAMISVVHGPRIRERVELAIKENNIEEKIRSRDSSLRWTLRYQNDEFVSSNVLLSEQGT